MKNTNQISVAKHCTQNLKVTGSSPTYHLVPSSQSQFGPKLPGDPSWIKASAQEYINSINMDLTWAVKHQPLEVQSQVTDAPETSSPLYLSVYVTAYVTPHFRQCCYKLDGRAWHCRACHANLSYSFIQNDLCPSERLFLSLNKW